MLAAWCCSARSSAVSTDPIFRAVKPILQAHSTTFPRKILANCINSPLFLFSIVLALSAFAFACSGDGNDVSETVLVPTQAPTTAPVPEPTEAPTAQELAKSATQVASDGNAVTADDVLATAFKDWGSTCLNDAYPTQAPKLDEVSEADFSSDPNGLEFVTIKQGEGAQPKLDWEVDVQYTGWLEDGCIFDSSYTRSEPTVFPVGAVIPGWQMTLTQMKVGERRRVVIPPDLAYGSTGSPPVIPPNATLTFDIILIGGTDPEAANAAATQVADDLLVQATALAKTYDTDAAPFDPIMVDYVTDVQGFLSSLPEGEVACMIAFAGNPETMSQFFTAGVRPSITLVEQFDECLSDSTTRNIAAGRIAIVGANLSDETLDCVGDTLKHPTIKPLFGIFDAAQVSEEWITSHFCLNASEREEFEKALYANQPSQTEIGSGKTFIDVQECMVDELGADDYFAPVQQPNTEDREAMTVFFTSFTPFMIADIRCRQGDAGFELPDGTSMSEDAARCVAEELGHVRFGEVFLDQTWLPSSEDHAQVAMVFTECGAETDFLNLPASIRSTGPQDTSCLLDELTNADDPSQTSARAFSQIGVRNPVKAGDFAALLFGALSCDIEISGLPPEAEVTDAAAICIVGKIDTTLYESGLDAVLPAFDDAIADSADCLE